VPAPLRHTPHRSRPKHQAANPVHVTLRCSVRSLRKQFVARTVVDALRESNSERFRIAHYSVQENHLHLIVEADSKEALSTGMRELMVRLAKRVNKLLFRRGRFWADRGHGNALTAPRQIRNALVCTCCKTARNTPIPKVAVTSQPLIRSPPPTGSMASPMRSR
jgi:REP element-mobilizing transposase RayT